MLYYLSSRCTSLEQYNTWLKEQMAQLEQRDATWIYEERRLIDGANAQHAKMLDLWRVIVSLRDSFAGTAYYLHNTALVTTRVKAIKTLKSFACVHFYNLK